MQAQRLQTSSLLSALRYCTATLNPSVNEEVLEEASQASHLEVAFATVGLRAQRLRAAPSDILIEAHPELPLLLRLPSGQAAGWLVIDGHRFGRVHLWSTSSFVPAGWMPIGKLTKLIGPEEREWVRVEALLQATPLAFDGKPVDKPTPAQRLLQLLRTERSAILVVVIYAVAVGILSLATPLAIQVLINWLAFGALYPPIIVLSVGLMVFLTIAAALRAVELYSVELIQRRIFARTVTDLGTRLTRVKLAGLDGLNGPELANRFFDVLTLQKAMKTLLLDGLTAALQAGVGLLLLAVYHPYLLVFDIIIVSLAFVALMPFFTRAEAAAIAQSKAKYNVAAWIEELARNPLAFKLGRSDLGEARLESKTRAYLTSRALHFRYFFMQYLGMQAVYVLVQVGLLLTAGWLVLEGQLTLGQLVAAEFIVASALAGLAKFTEKLETIYDLLAGVDKIGELMDLPQEQPFGAVANSDSASAVDVREVGFAWPRGPKLLANINLQLPPGARVSIVGAPGCGKSVLAELICGVRFPQQGTVWRDGIPTTRTFPETRNQATLLLRPGVLIQGSVLDNVAMGDAGIEEQSLWDAMRAVGIADAISALPKGLQQNLGAHGEPLSRTQAMLMQLASGLAIAPPLLVVDGLLDGLPEPTRSLVIDQLLALPDTCTLVVLTESASVANRFQPTYQLRDGALHARPKVVTT